MIKSSKSLVIGIAAALAGSVLSVLHPFSTTARSQPSKILVPGSTRTVQRGDDTILSYPPRSITTQVSPEAARWDGQPDKLVASPKAFPSTVVVSPDASSSKTLSMHQVGSRDSHQVYTQVPDQAMVPGGTLEFLPDNSPRDLIYHGLFTASSSGIHLIPTDTDDLDMALTVCAHHTVLVETVTRYQPEWSQSCTKLDLIRDQMLAQKKAAQVERDEAADQQEHDMVDSVIKRHNSLVTGAPNNTKPTP